MKASKAQNENNNTASDDDDSVFLKSDSHSKPATQKKSSVMLNVSSTTSKTLAPQPSGSQNLNIVSCETDLQSERLRR